MINIFERQYKLQKDDYMNNFSKGAFYAIISAIGYGIMPIFTVKAYHYGVSVYTLLFLRFIISSVIFFAFLLFKRINMNIGKKDLKNLFLLGGILFTLLSILHFESIKYIPSSMAVLFLYTFPMLVCVISFFVYKEKISLASLLSLLISFISMVYLLGVSLNKINTIGVLLSLLAALVYAFYMIIGKKVADNNSPMVTSAFSTLFGAIGVLTLGILNRNISWNFDSTSWIYIILIVFLSTVFAEIAFFKSLELLSPSNVSIISMVEPLFTSVFALIFLKETLGLSQILGGIFVLIGLTLLVYFQNKSVSNQMIKNREMKKGKYV